MFRRALPLVLILAALACGAPSSSATPVEAAAQAPAPSDPPPPALEWTAIKTWSGNGMKETERFRTTRREWRIQWETRNEALPGAGIFQIYVHDAETGGMVSLAANRQGTGSDTSYVRAPAGEFYLMFNSANVDYRVTVEEER